MLCLTTGRERTKEEFATIFRRAGLRLVKLHATTGPVVIVEGKAV